MAGVASGLGVVPRSANQPGRATASPQGRALIRVGRDLKIDDGKVEADVVKLANKHGVLHQVLFIGTTIDSSAVRRRIKKAGAKAPVAVLAQTAADLPAALADAHADWAYVR